MAYFEPPDPRDPIDWDKEKRLINTKRVATSDIGFPFFLIFVAWVLMGIIDENTAMFSAGQLVFGFLVAASLLIFNYQRRLFAAESAAVKRMTASFHRQANAPIAAEVACRPIT